MSVLISGSVAYDTILTFPGTFKESLVENSLEKLTLTFESDSCERRFGGCAANIAYAMKLLGADPIVWSSVGYDAADYLERFSSLGIKTSLYQSSQLMTAQCFTTIDREGNQLSTFASNAMNLGQLAPWPHNESPSFAFFSPDTRLPMLHREKALLEHGVPFVFDPGQTIPQFSDNELKRLISEAFLTIVNAYEITLLEQKTNLSLSQLRRLAKKLIITKGSEGSSYFDENETLHVAAFAVANADPVGAGDAFRGGLGAALENKLSSRQTLALAAAMASFKVQTPGTQNYRPSQEEIQTRMNLLLTHNISTL